MMPRSLIPMLAGALMLAASSAAPAQDGKYPDPGISDTEVVIGSSYPFSGPAAAYGVVSEGAQAYFGLVNDRGGVNGRKIRFVVLDDAYQPSRVVTNIRQLVERDHVFAIFNIAGTAHNLAVLNYINEQKIPQLYINTGADVFGLTPDKNPWTLIGIPSYGSEAAAFAQYLNQVKPQAKVSVLYQADAFGQDLLRGLKTAVQGSTVSLVAEESYNPTEPSVDSQVSKLQRSGADVFVNFSIPKFAAQAIRRVSELGWKPLQLLTSVSASTELVLKPAGLETAQGIVSTAFLKDPSDPRFAEDPGVLEYKVALTKAFLKANPSDPLRIRGYALAQVLVKALQDMKEPSRVGLMSAAVHMDAELPMFLPGTRIVTSPTNYFPIQHLTIERFEGDRWALQGEPIDTSKLRSH
jgi:branched-chain amino acid transport system substrate-binding protein